MAPEDARSADMLVLIRWHGRTMAVPLSQLAAIDPDEATAGAIGDWHYPRDPYIKQRAISRHDPLRQRQHLLRAGHVDNPELGDVVEYQAVGVAHMGCAVGPTVIRRSTFQSTAEHPLRDRWWLPGPAKTFIAAVTMSEVANSLVRR